LRDRSGWRSDADCHVFDLGSVGTPVSGDAVSGADASAGGVFKRWLIPSIRHRFPSATGSTPSNSVPIVVINDCARVAVSLGDYPLPQTMVVDTGASVMNIPRDLAAELIKRGVATADGTLIICVADGTCNPRVRIWIDKVTVGPRVVEHVAAIIAPDGSELLLPFSVHHEWRPRHDRHREGVTHLRMIRARRVKRPLFIVGRSPFEAL
jgi:Aspartyl protease